MTPQQYRKKWIDLLRSGKYEQTDSVLCSIGQGNDAITIKYMFEAMESELLSKQMCFCAMGIGAIALGKDNIDKPLKIYELSDEDMSKFGMGDDHKKWISTMNDLDHKSFAEIADYIEGLPHVEAK